MTRLEDRQILVRDIEQAVQVHTDDRVPHLPGHLQESAVACDPRIVYQDADWSERILNLLDHVVDFILRSHVRHDRAAADALVLDHAADFLRLLPRVLVIKNNISATLRQCQ